MSPNEMRALVDRYLDAYNRMDVDGMLTTLHRDVQFENISNGVTTASANGISELRTLAEQTRPLFVSRRQTILSFECGNHTANATIAFWAVVSDDLPNGLRKGQEIRLSGRSEFGFRDGLISRIVDIS